MHINDLHENECTNAHVKDAIDQVNFFLLKYLIKKPKIIHQYTWI